MPTRLKPDAVRSPRELKELERKVVKSVRVPT
jgi:hypothetical protein